MCTTNSVLVHTIHCDEQISVSVPIEIDQLVVVMVNEDLYQ